jgi:formate dehydrogenase iron-sulfur subunit
MRRRQFPVKREHPMALLADTQDVSVIYLLVDDPMKYHAFSIARIEPGMDRKTFFAKLAAPLGKGLRRLVT